VISVITPTYNTEPGVLARTWASLKRQTFTDWEWVVLDDSENNYVWRQLFGYASDERYRIKLLKPPHSGSIGKVKHDAFMAADGQVLVELDHDDELMPDALLEVAAAFHDETVGFVYSDWCEINEAGESCRYPKGWAYGYGGEYWDRSGVWAMAAPAVNDRTARHIVSMPNHVRAWRASVYRELGGHDTELPVADDYELCVRTVLNTEWVHIPKMLYRQHISSRTAQRQRNADIQKYVAEIAARYSDQITERFSNA
jgi:glycosyltransferase involved in cell wall biosynthesis